MKNLWRSRAFKIFRVSASVMFTAYLAFLVGRSIQTYRLSNGEMLSENVADYKKNYYFTFGHVKEKEAIQLDSNLVYYVDYSKIKSLGVSNQLVYSPVTLALNAIRSYQKWILNQDTYEREVFLANANWLVENINDKGEWILTQDVSVGQYTVKAPWCSGLAQGLGISVLARAYGETGHLAYAETARKALAPFYTDITAGGVRTTNEFGVFYEEYPLPENPTHVLNGFVYSLFGLYDLYLFDNNTEALALFQEGINGLQNALPLFDTGDWTLYSLNRESNLRNHWNYCSPWYQKLHTNQVKALYNITGQETFRTYAVKFENYRDNSSKNYIIYPAYIAYTDFVWLVRKIS
ncbi:MAG: hypothetical protein KDC12_02460 [Flavobacteriales bacterium]|nr:hypothetical protein [Flavobacteriales bacterium]